jgi:hypothetical protein
VDTVPEDGFVVYVRQDPAHSFPPENAERPIIHCASYEEARRVWQQWHNSAQHCVIRYLGTVGGGD